MILDSSQWFDTDGDGYGDNEFGTRGDSCPTEEGYSTIDVYGCLDSDSDEEIEVEKVEIEERWYYKTSEDVLLDIKSHNICGILVDGKIISIDNK